MPKISKVWLTSVYPCCAATWSAHASTVGAEHLHGGPARAAHQMVVVAVAAPAVQVLAARRAHHVEVAGVGEGLQRAVHGGQPDPFAALAQHRVQVLGAVETLHLVQQCRDGAALPGVR